MKNRFANSLNVCRIFEMMNIIIFFLLTLLSACFTNEIPRMVKKQWGQISYSIDQEFDTKLFYENSFDSDIYLNETFTFPQVIQ